MVVVAAAAAGGLSGALVTTFLSNKAADVAPRKEEIGDVPGVVTTQIVRHLFEYPRDPPEESLPRESASSSDLGADSSSPAPVFETQEEAAHRLSAAVAERERRHHADPRDVTWATSAEGTYVEDLRGLASSGDFQVRGVDCRTTSCRATLEWSSRSQAQAALRTVLHHNYVRNCAVELLLPPTERAGAYEASVYFDCTDERAAAVPR
jgi:hypothetical protein